MGEGLQWFCSLSGLCVLTLFYEKLCYEKLFFNDDFKENWFYVDNLAGGYVRINQSEKSGNY
ncbi:hypothetical protein AU378_00300 [Chryseobacterium kwangjuense]|uniref:Uncharacterized protein n=1 Tax=Chryseobacterium kwangjuense TaxID=267125 RepID=A0A135WH96_9FLAO|nr:hypothetical protein AU378_00300 [Chryseobacterium kwangjuense]